MSDLVRTESISAIWMQVPEESDLWYRRFISYYLPLGPARNLTRAYVRYLKTESPESESKKTAKRTYTNIANSWSDAARRWKWRERAEAFDLFNASENFAYVDQARETLLRNADEAAKALVQNLTNPRLGVAAAKEILDRAGLPGTHIVGVGKIEPYTADDLRKAEQEVTDWERQIRGDIVDVDPG